MTTTNNDFDHLFGGRPLMGIFRGLGAERSVALASLCWDLGIDSIELPIQTDADVEALHLVAAEARLRGKSVGAGTVITMTQVELARDAGASYTVSPGLDIEIVRASMAAGLPPLPGVATATDVQAAVREGLTWLKAFPASLLGSAWLEAMHAPFPEVKFVATGGMRAQNALQFLRAGAKVVAVGSALADESQLPDLARILREYRASSM